MRRQPGKECFCPFFAKTAHQKLRGGESIQSQARQQQRVSREAGHGAENFRSQLSPLLSEGSHECAPGIAIAPERRFSITEIAFQHHRRTVGHSVTLILPSASRCKVGAYNPTNCRCHHIPVCRFSAMVVNQYCQSTARTWVGGWRGKGLPAKRASTSASFSSSRTSVLGTIGYSRHEPSEANHKFQSKRG